MSCEWWFNIFVAGEKNKGTEERSRSFYMHGLCNASHYSPLMVMNGTMQHHHHQSFVGSSMEEENSSHFDPPTISPSFIDFLGVGTR